MIKLVSRFWRFMTVKPAHEPWLPPLQYEPLPLPAVEPPKTAEAATEMPPQPVDQIQKIAEMYLRSDIDRYRFKNWLGRLLASATPVDDIATGLTYALESFIGRTQHIDFKIVADRADGEAILRVVVARK